MMKWFFSQKRQLPEAVEQIRSSAEYNATPGIAVTWARHFDFQSEEYCELYAHSEATSFQHPIWADRMTKHLMSAEGKSFRVLLARRVCDGSLCLAMPFHEYSLGPCRFVDALDNGVCDYNFPVFDPAIFNKEAAWEIVQNALDSWRKLVRVRRVRMDHAPSASAPGRSRVNLMGYHAHEVKIYKPFDVWRKSNMRAGFVKSLGNYRRRLERQGNVRFQQLSDPVAISEAFTSMRLFRKARFERDALQTDTIFEFYKDVARAGLADGFTRTYVLSLDDRVIATIFGLSSGYRFMFLLLGFEQSSVLHNIGLLTIESLIQDCIERGEAVFDFTIGDEPYKTNFGTTSVPMLAIWHGNTIASACAQQLFRAVVHRRSAKSQGH